MRNRGYKAQKGKGHETYERELLQPDPGRMMARSLGILVHLCSLPPDFNVSAESLAKVFKEGRVAISASLDELESLGHLARKRVQDPETGQWGWIWVYGEDPYTVAATFAERIAEHAGAVAERQLPNARRLRSA